MTSKKNKFATIPRVPPPGKGAPPEEREFDRQCRDIVNEYLTRLGHSARAKLEARTALRRVCYIALNQRLEDDELHLLEWRIEYYGRGIRGSVGERTPFQTGLLAIFAHDTTAQSTAAREVMGKQLWYAARHFVPVEFLDGFIKQVGADNVRHKVSINAIEPGFDDWIAKSLVEFDKVTEHLGRYPKSIHQLIDQAEAASNGSEESNWD